MAPLTSQPGGDTARPDPVLGIQPRAPRMGDGGDVVGPVRANPKGAARWARSHRTCCALGQPQGPAPNPLNPSPSLQRAPTAPVQSHQGHHGGQILPVLGLPPAGLGSGDHTGGSHQHTLYPPGAQPRCSRHPLSPRLPPALAGKRGDSPASVRDVPARSDWICATEGSKGRAPATPGYLGRGCREQSCCRCLDAQLASVGCRRGRRGGAVPELSWGRALGISVTWQQLWTTTL